MVVMVMVVAAIVIVVPMPFPAVFLPPVVFMSLLTPMLFHAFMAVALRRTLTLAALPKFVPFLCARFPVAADCIRMDVFAAIHPGPSPWSIIDNDNAAVPGNAVITPAPGPEADA